MGMTQFGFFLQNCCDDVIDSKLYNARSGASFEGCHFECRRLLLLSRCGELFAQPSKRAFLKNSELSWADKDSGTQHKTAPQRGKCIL